MTAIAQRTAVFVVLVLCALRQRQCLPHETVILRLDGIGTLGLDRCRQLLAEHPGIGQSAQWHQCETGDHAEFAIAMAPVQR